MFLHDADSIRWLDKSPPKFLDIIPVGDYFVEASHPYEEQGVFMIAVTTGLPK
jgi:hypothetical protein